MTRAKTGDAKIIEKFIILLADNANVFAGFVDGNVDLGALGDILKSMDVDVNEMLPAGGFETLIKEGIVGAVYEDENSEEYKAALNKAKTSLDAFIYEDMVSDLLSKDILPGFTMNGSTTFDGLFKSVFKICWDKYLTKLIKDLHVDLKGSDNEALKKLGDIMVLDGTQISTDIPLNEAASASFASQINNIVGYMAKQFFPNYTGWVSGDSSKLGANLNALYLYAAKALGITDGINTSDSSAVAFAVVKYVLANIESETMNEYIAGIDSCKTLKQVAVVVLRNTAKINHIPVTANTSATYENIVGDIVTYYVGKSVVLPYDAGAGKDIWTVLNDIVNIFLYDKGLAKALNMSTTKDKDVFAKLDEIIAKTKIFNGLKGDYTTKTFFKDGILEALFSLDLAKLVDITAVKFMSDFGTKSVSNVVYDAIYNFLYGWLGRAILVARATANPLNNAVKNANLQTMLKNFLTAINAKRAYLIPVVLYAGALIIGDKPASGVVVSSDAQEYTGDVVVPLTAKVVVGGKTYSLKLGRDFDVVSTTADNYNLGSTVTAKISLYGYVKTEAEVKYSVKLGTVRNLKASSVTTNSAILSWDAVPGAEKYEVILGGKVIASPTANSLKVTLPAATEYKYTVKAVSGAFTGAAADVTVISLPVKANTPVVAAVNNSAVKLTWKATPGATGYVLERYLGSNKWGTVKVVNATSYLVTGLNPKTSYYFRIKAYKKGTNGAVVYGEPSANVNVLTTLPAPKLVASASTNSAIKITWSKVSGAAGYQVEQFNGKSWVVVIKSTTANTYVFSKLKVNTLYQYRVRAFYKYGTRYVFGNYSSILKVSTAPAASTKVVVSSPTSNTLKVTWKAVSGTTGYRVYYSTNNKTWKYVNVSKNYVVLTKLNANQKYYIKVQAFKSTAGIYAFGAYSPLAAGTTNVAKVTGLKAAKTTKNSVTLAWSKVPGAAGYTVYRQQGSKWVKVANVKTNSFTNSKLSRNTAYNYYVAAYKIVGKTVVYGDKSAVLKTRTRLF